MSNALQWHRVRWPREVEAERLTVMSAVLVTSGGAPVVVETIGRAAGVEHRLGLPVRRSEAIVEQLRNALPGLGLHVIERQPINSSRAIELRLSTPMRSLRSQQSPSVSRALLTALSLSRRGEQLVLQWQLLTSLPARSVGSTEHAEPSPASVADVLLGRVGRLDAEARQALRAKRELPVWRALGRIAVRAGSTAREEALLREVVAALRLAEAPGVRVFARRCSANSLDRVGRSWRAPLRLNTAELVAVAGWPIGATAGLPVEHAGARLLPPAKSIPSRGRIVLHATSPGAERRLALSTSDSLRHLHVLGPTGTGKSTLLLNGIVQDIAAGRAVVVIEPKGDLISDVLHRIPAERVDDVVLIDPSDEQPVGLNPLAADRVAAELVADQLLGMFRSLYESSWGPRTNDILGASLLTLARTPNMTLCALPALLANPHFRQQVVAGLDDPLALEPFWAAYESWSEAERTAAVAPVMNKVRPFLLRPQLRAILGQSRPRVTLRGIFAERKILLVNLAKGAIGGEAAALLGSLIVAQLWSAALNRTTVARERRAPAFIYIDEFQDYLHLPTDLGEALAQARSLGVGFVLAHQNLSQLIPSTRSAVLANARSRICFQLAAEDARAVADGPLAAADFRELPTFEVYAQLVAEGAVQPWCSGRTLPPPMSISTPAAVQEASRRNYGVDRRTVDAQLERLSGAGRNPADDLTPRRRADRGPA